MHSLLLAAALGIAPAAQSTPEGVPQGPLLVAAAPAPTPLERALADARQSGKPVLVIVISPSPLERACRSRWLSDWLVVGGERFLAELALVEVAFATREQLRALLPPRRRALAERGEVGLLEALERELDWSPLESESGTWCVSNEASAHPVAYGEAMARLVAELQRWLSNDGGKTAQRATAARRSLNAAELAEFEASLIHPTHARLALVDRCAWLYRRSLQLRRASGFGKFEPALASAASARLIDLPPHGARWASFDGARLNVRVLERDDALDLERLRLRAFFLRAPALDAPADRWIRDQCSTGPCGTGFSGAPSYVFLNEYTRVLVDATDLD